MLIQLIFVFIFNSLVQAQLRLCEAEGTCRHCQDGRYSYYRCRMQDDCFIGEVCDDGFCCPNNSPTFLPQNETGKDSSRSCPDGSNWQKICSSDLDCNQDGRVCIEGKCCKTCAVRRREMLDALRTVEILGQAIPQCEENEIFYRKRQCLAGTDVCWCVTPHGRRLSRKEYRDERECETVRRKQENLALKAAALLKSDDSACAITYAGVCPKPASIVIYKIQCQCDSDCQRGEKCCQIKSLDAFLTACVPIVTNTPLRTPSLAQSQKTNTLSPTLTLICGVNEQFTSCYSPCQPSCQDPSTPACGVTVNCVPGCACLPGFVRRDGSPRSPCVPRALCQAYDLTVRCADERRQYQTCGSACPVSCSNRHLPRCLERCVTGCFCRLPYILENDEDPLHSRCVLPTDCPAFNVGSYPTPPPSLLPPPVPTKPAQHCSDPLKNFQSCGSKCPAACDRPHSASLECTLSCVAGCYCRAPYILVDSNDINSSCILPQLCPKTKINSTKSCADPRKEWSECGGSRCSRSCTNPLGRCSKDQCASGCVCREPYVALHPSDPTSRCVLPSECEHSCEDPAKEYISCGSSCPMGCDNRHPKTCSPCQTGCFCRSGLVFENSATWHTSKCIKLEECPNDIENSTSTTTESTTTHVSTPSSSTKRPIETTTEATFSNVEDKFGLEVVHAIDTACPSTTFDVGGRGCDSDIDCPQEQRCCQSLIVSLGVAPQRCVCPDPHAVWSACGTLCPEYCGQPSVPVCSSTCSAGCHCAPGYIKARNDVTAPCVKRSSCNQSTSITAFANRDDAPRATIREIPIPKIEKNEPSAVAVVLSSYDGTPTGRFTFTNLTPTSVHVTGSLKSNGRHAVAIHQYGDASDGCRRIGAPFSKSPDTTPSLGDTSNGRFEEIINWSSNDVIGRSIVIYQFPTSEWDSRTHVGQPPLACGIIGIATR